jgi:hypothetical protein
MPEFLDEADLAVASGVVLAFGMVVLKQDQIVTLLVAVTTLQV